MKIDRLVANGTGSVLFLVVIICRGMNPGMKVGVAPLPVIANTPFQRFPFQFHNLIVEKNTVYRLAIPGQDSQHFVPLHLCFRVTKENTKSSAGWNKNWKRHQRYLSMHA